MQLLDALETRTWELPPQRVRIRVVDERDLPLLEWHGGADLRAFYREALNAHAQGLITYLVSELNGFPIGQVIVHWSGKESVPGVPDVQSLRVHPAFRGQGVGSKLLEAAESVVANAGHSHVTLSVGVKNPQAQKLYERCGYEVASKVYEDSWETINADGHPTRFHEVIFDMMKRLR